MRSDIPFIGQVETQERNDWINAINERCSSFRLAPLASLTGDSLNKAEVAVVANPEPATLNALPNLKWIQSLWAGVEGILGSGLKAEVAIVRLTDPQMAESMAEAVLAWTLYLHRKMPQYKLLQTKHKWQQLPLKLPRECNVTVFGLGKLGTQAALRLQQNQFTVRGWSNSEKSIDGIETYYGNSGFDSVLSKTDIAILLLPLTDSTKNLFDKAQLSKLADGASVINFARGPIIVEADLIDCLNQDKLAHAVLDVFNEEPLPENHPLWSHSKVTVLPHISAPTTVSTAAAIAAQNIDQYFSTGVVPPSVDRGRGY